MIRFCQAATLAFCVTLFSGCAASPHGDVGSNPAANTVVVTLINPVRLGRSAAPLATRENIARTLSELARLVRPQDQPIVSMSIHSAPNRLAPNIDNRNDAHVTASDLMQWLQPLQGKPTWLPWSACRSGSPIRALQGADRIVLTAAARDQHSFGCNVIADGRRIHSGSASRASGPHPFARATDGASQDGHCRT